MEIVFGWSLLNVDWPAILVAALAGIGWSAYRSWQRKRQ